MTDTYTDQMEQQARPGFGSIEDGVAGRYDFSVTGVLGEAWSKTSGNKGTAWIAVIIMVVVLGVFSLIVRYLLQHFGIGIVPGDEEATKFRVDAIEKFFEFFVNVPLSAGLTMIGIKMAVQAPTKWEDIFNYFEKMVVLVATTILMYVMIIAGLFLLILPGIYLTVAYSMAIPLVIDKGLSPWEALETSRKAVSHHWFKIFGMYLLFALIVLVSLIPIFVGLIWTVPMGMLMLGIVYRTMFGYSGELETIRIAE